MASWEQALRQHLSGLLPSTSAIAPKESLWHAFTGHADAAAWIVGDALAMASQDHQGAVASQQPSTGKAIPHRLPPFFSDKNWDLGRKSCTGNSNIASKELTSLSSHTDAKSVFYSSKRWDSGGIVGGQSRVDNFPELLKLDASTAFSQQRSCNFTVQSMDSFGMVLEESPEPLPGGLLAVTSVDPCSAFAKTSTGTRGIMGGDIIVEVNGHRGNAAELGKKLRQAFCAPGSKVIKILTHSRPPTFDVELRRDGPQWQRLGFSVKSDPISQQSLLVESVRTEGVVPEWNAANGSLRICKGDHITHVNGVSKDLQEMKKEIQRSSTKGCTLIFRIVTPAISKELTSREVPSVPWGMHKQRPHNNNAVSEVSTACSGSIISGVRTPEEVFSSGASTPEKRYS